MVKNKAIYKLVLCLIFASYVQASVLFGECLRMCNEDCKLTTRGQGELHKLRGISILSMRVCMPAL